MPAHWRGWAWTPEEKAWIKTWKRRLQAQVERVSEDIKQFETALPEYASEVADICQSYLKVAKPLLDLDGRKRGRKYQPMSPEEAKLRLDEAQRKFREYMDFLNRPDVRQAIKQFNQEQRRAEREYQRQMEEAKQAILQVINTREFMSSLEHHIELQIKEAMPFVLFMGLQTLPSCGDEDKPFWAHFFKRLFVVQVVYAVCYHRPSVRQDLIHFIKEKNEPPLREVLNYAVYLLIRECALIESPLSMIPKSIELAFRWFTAYTRIMQRSKVTPQELKTMIVKKEIVKKVTILDETTLDRRMLASFHWFIFGHDYSLAAHPEE